MLPEDFILNDALKPLNIRSYDEELVAREMSNFEECPFELDGQRFQSVEAFYIWLKFFGDEENRNFSKTLYGVEAKEFGRHAKCKVTEYDGKSIVLGSDDHHALIKRAIRAKLECYSDLVRRFAATHPRPIVHELRAPEPSSRFPAEVFALILTELRQELIDEKIVTVDGAVSELAKKATLVKDRQPRLPISEVILQQTDRPSSREHPLPRYAKVLEESGIVVSSFLAAGADHMAFVTPDNQVLKLTTSLFPNQFFERQFHLHIFDSQIIDGGGGFKLQLYKQPRGKFVSVEQYRAFLELIKRLEYVLFDGGIEQLSLYNGGAKLHDPFAVQRDSRLGRP